MQRFSAEPKYIQYSQDSLGSAVVTNKPPGLKGFIQLFISHCDLSGFPWWAPPGRDSRIKVFLLSGVPTLFRA